MDAYALLDLPRQAQLDAAIVREHFQAARGARGETETETEAAQQALEEAYRLLARPASRLSHLMTLLGHPPARAAVVSEQLMTLFGKCSVGLQAADLVLAKKSGCQTALAKALLSREALAAELTLSELAGEIMQQRNHWRQQAAAWDELPPADRQAALLAPMQTAFAFIEKWDLQVQERRLRLAD